MARRQGFSPEVNQALAAASQRWNIPLPVLRGFTQIESGGNPRAQTGSYGGLLQLSPSEFRRGGGRGSIYDPFQNAMAGGSILAGHRAELAKSLGREPTWNEVYMAHQQGMGGFTEHARNPEGLAWQNMANTPEGRQRDARGPVYRMPDGTRGLWSQSAIAGNLPRGSGLDWRTATSGQFQQFWGERLGRAGVPQAGEPSLVAASNVTPDTSSGLQPGSGIAAYGDQGAASPDPQPNPPDRPRDLSALSAAELTRMAPPNEPPFDTSAVGGIVSQVAQSLGPPVVQGVNPAPSQSIGAMFGAGSASNVGAALSAAGKAIAGSGPRIPQFADPATQMAALDSREPFPTIPVRPRREFGMRRG